MQFPDGQSLLTIASLGLETSAVTFSIFQRISAASPPGETFLRPSVTREGDVVTIDVPCGDDSKKFWLIESNRRLADSEQCFRGLVWSHFNPSDARHPTQSPWSSIVGVEQLRPISRATASGATENAIVVRLPFDRAVRAYVYHDHAEPVIDGGYYCTIDVPSFLIEADPPSTSTQSVHKALRWQRIVLGTLIGISAIVVSVCILVLLLGLRA